MKEVIAAILTNPEARGVVEVESLLLEQAKVAAPWAD